MKRTLIAIYVVLAMICSASLSSVLAVEPGTISVTGEATAMHSPDTATLTFAIETQDKNATKATSKNRTVANAIISAVKPMLNEAKGDYIKTQSYSVRPQHKYNSKTKKSEFLGYKVSNTMTVKTKSTDKVGSIIDKALAAGANRVNGVNFTIEDNKKYCQELLVKASKEAKQEAILIAESLGAKITGIKHVTSSCSKNSVRPRTYYGRTMLKTNGIEAASATPIEAGDIKVYSSVSIDFYIE